MVKFLDYISNRLRPYSFYITAIIVSIIFIIVSYYAVTSIMKKKIGSEAEFSDVANNGTNVGETDIKFFYVDWCPYCKKALPDWQSFCDEYNGKKVNRYIINCDRNGTNCTDENDPEVKANMEKYDIKSFPTVILFKDNKKYEFDAKVTKNALEQFVMTVTKD